MTYKDFLEKVAREAGKTIKENFSFGMEKEYKDDVSPVTVTDTTINSYIIEQVQEYFPNHSVKGEEESFIKEGSEYVWVCDPVDGTIPFSSGFPICTFALALCYKGHPIAGVIYDPFMDRMLIAEQGKGSFLNDSPIRVNSKKRIDETSIIALECFKTAKYDLTEVHRQLVEKRTKTFQLCSIMYAGIGLAVGEFDIVIFPHITPHDGAALQIIIEEAGGKMTSIKGKTQKFHTEIDGYIATNGIIHSETLELVTQYLKEN